MKKYLQFPTNPSVLKPSSQKNANQKSHSRQDLLKMFIVCIELCVCVDSVYVCSCAWVVFSQLATKIAFFYANKTIKEQIEVQMHEPFIITQAHSHTNTTQKHTHSHSHLFTTANPHTCIKAHTKNQSL